MGAVFFFEMKKFVLLVFSQVALLFGNSCMAQSAEILNGKWSADSYVNLRSQEVPFTLDLTGGKFNLAGPDQTFPQFSNYIVEGNKLTVFRDKKHGDKPKRRAEFLILAVSGQELRLQALNWPAVYIADVVRTPKKKIDESAYLNMDDFELDGTDSQLMELVFRHQ